MSCGDHFPLSRGATNLTFEGVEYELQEVYCGGCAFGGSEWPGGERCGHAMKLNNSCQSTNNSGWVKVNTDGVNRSMRAALDAAPMGQKLSNPKDLIGSSKLPLNLVPDSLLIYASMAFAEGASKYGAFNWRIAGVRLSIYKAAHDRHMSKYWNGEECDPVTKVPHLASAMACLGIIADAKLCGKLTDDRPPAVDVDKLIREAEEVVAHLMQLNADKKPRHYTIADSV